MNVACNFDLNIISYFQVAIPKKGHKRINPDNKNYDRFFMVNYKNEKQCSYGQRLKFKPNTRTKTAKTHSQINVKNQPSISGVTFPASEPRTHQTPESNVFQTGYDSDSDWSDWEGEKQVLTYLYCTLSNTDFAELKKHIKEEHKVDFDEATAEFTFYDRVKIVNFVRRQMHIMKCITCGSQCTTAAELQQHLQDKQHFGIGDKTQWDLAEYFFPTYEDDAFLCSLDDTYDSDDGSAVALKENDASVVVHSEEPKMFINPDAEALSKEQLLEF